MEWITTLVGWLFGWLFRRKANAPAPAATPEPAPATDGEATHAASPEEELYAHAPEAAISRGQQHHWLIDEGVLHWNQRRKDKEFRPDFAGYDFVGQARGSRLWGLPVDLAGGERVLLAGVDLRFAKLARVKLSGADLRRAHLQGADLRGADLARVNLAEADLTDCDLREAVLDGADLSRTRLVNANLAGASVTGANLAWADLTHAAAGKLAGANLFGVKRG
jgi:hypothetical protein